MDTERDRNLERWRNILLYERVEAVGHRLVTHGAHTANMAETVALCENPTIAKAIAEAIERQRQK